jgi:hypothetical protein
LGENPRFSGRSVALLELLGDENGRRYNGCEVEEVRSCYHASNITAGLIAITVLTPIPMWGRDKMLKEIVVERWVGWLCPNHFGKGKPTFDFKSKKYFDFGTQCTCGAMIGEENTFFFYPKSVFGEFVVNYRNYAFRRHDKDQKVMT